jgi:hypothetical protein
VKENVDDGMVPSLRGLSEAALAEVAASIGMALRDCEVQTQTLKERKDALLVELGIVSESLENVFVCVQQLQETKASMLDILDESLGAEEAARWKEHFAAPPSAPLVGSNRPMPSSPSQHTASNPTSARSRSTERGDHGTNQGAKETRARRRARGGKLAGATLPDSSHALADAKAKRLAMALPSDEAERRMLTRRQVVVRGMPPGEVDEARLAAAIDAAFVALPAFDACNGSACTKVQLYGGGTYAFVALRDHTLAATAANFPTLTLSGSALSIARVRGFEEDIDGALPLPSDLDLPAAVAVATSSLPAVAANLETKLCAV